MNLSSSHSPGHPLVSAAVVGSCSFALALVLEILGVYHGVSEGLWHAYDMQGFKVGESVPGGVSGLWVVGILAYAIAWVTSEIPGVHRRILVLLSSLVLIALASPILALWGTFWNPVPALVATAWSGFCAILWASQHPMPCERVTREQAGSGKIIPMKEGTRKKVKRQQS